VAAAALFCHVCGAVQPPRDLQQYVGVSTQYHSDEPFEFKAAYVAELRETNPNFENAVHTHCATVREQRDLTGRAAAQLTRCAL